MKKQTMTEHKTAEAVRLALQLAPECVALFELPSAMYRAAQKFGVTGCKLSFEFCQKTVKALQADGRL